MNLQHYTAPGYHPGRSLMIQVIWYAFFQPLVSSRIPGSRWRSGLLRLFGASIGSAVVIKPGVKIKFPWKLQVGDHVWIGEDAWIDNLDWVKIGNHVCVSQAVYLCTGNHDWKSDSFTLRTAPIFIHPKAWIAARCTVGPGVEIMEGSVLTLGSVALNTLTAWTIHTGHPALPVKPRVMHS